MKTTNANLCDRDSQTKLNRNEIWRRSVAGGGGGGAYNSEEEANIRRVFTRVEIHCAQLRGKIVVTLAATKIHIILLRRDETSFPPECHTAKETKKTIDQSTTPPSSQNTRPTVINRRRL